MNNSVSLSLSQGQSQISIRSFEHQNFFGEISITLSSKLFFNFTFNKLFDDTVQRRLKPFSGNLIGKSQQPFEVINAWLMAA